MRMGQKPSKDVFARPTGCGENAPDFVQPDLNVQGFLWRRTEEGKKKTVGFELGSSDRVRRDRREHQRWARIRNGMLDAVCSESAGAWASRIGHGGLPRRSRARRVAWNSGAGPSCRRAGYYGVRFRQNRAPQGDLLGARQAAR